MMNTKRHLPAYVPTATYFSPVTMALAHALVLGSYILMARSKFKACYSGEVITHRRVEGT